VHTGGPLVHLPIYFEVESATKKFKRYITPGINQIPAELIQAGGNTPQSTTY
jgi:hypothetical protein